MHVKTNVKAGGRQLNHNETQVKDSAKSKTAVARPLGLRVKTNVKAGRVGGSSGGGR